MLSNPQKEKGDEMKYIFLFFVLCIALYLGQVRLFEEYLYPGQELDILVNVVNYDYRDLDDVRVTVFIPEMGLYFRSRSFDVEDRDAYGSVVFEDIPKDAMKGDYLVKISIHNEDIEESTYRYITIV